MNTNKLGDIALAMVIADLIERQQEVYLPVNDHAKADLVALVQGKPYKIQVKHSSDGMVRKDSVTTSKKGISRSEYQSDEVDIFGVYLSEIKRVIYVPHKHAGIKIRWVPTKNNQKCWWYEDFLTLDFSVEKQQKRV